MPSDIEYALLSTRVYAASSENRAGLPEGWTEQSWQPDAGFSGFSAGAYRRGGEVVIAYTGTNQTADWFNGNVAAVGGLAPAGQIFEAMRFYLDVKAANPDATSFTFTGHSLGGGLASLMSVFFDKQALVFDEAPFLLSAANSIVLAGLQVSLLVNGYTDLDFALYNASFGTLLPFRISNVRHTYLDGEILGVVRSVFPAIASATNIVSMGASNSSALDRHAMTLLTAMIGNDAFRSLVQVLPNLATDLLDPRLFGVEDRSVLDKTDLLTNLLRMQFGDAQRTADGRLERFSAEIQKLIGSSVGVAQTLLSRELSIVAMEYFAIKVSGEAGQVFTAEGGGLHFAYSNFDPTASISYKSLPRLVTAIQTSLAASEKLVAGRLTAQNSWHIQEGGGVLNWTGGDLQNDAAIGGLGDDVMDAGSGADILIGGAGNDTLTGGSGSDTLLGGAGSDSYFFATGSGRDTIVDVGGEGVIKIGGVVISGGAKAAPDYYIGVDSAGVMHGYALVASSNGGIDLIITQSSGPERITIRDWHPGELGITLAGIYAGPDPLPTRVIITLTEDADNYKTDSETNDQLIDGLGGSDVLAGGRGDDSILGGLGNDLITGSSGRDTIMGGAGTDIIFGSVHRFSIDPEGVAPASHGVELARGAGWVVYLDPVGGRDIFIANSAGTSSLSYTNFDDYGKFIDGGAGTDYIFSGTGDDVVHGGADNDEVTGMAGHDILFGDDGNDIMIGDGPVLANLGAGYTPLSLHGDDILDGGGGNDHLTGQGGNDSLYGGIGNDSLSGDIEGDVAVYAPLSGHGDDYLDGGDGNDQLVGGAKDDQLFGGIDDDRLYGDGAPDKIDGAFHGRDYLYGEEGNDYMEGQGSTDALFGGIGNDTMWGDAGVAGLSASQNGDDYLDGGDGEDMMIGGGGADDLFGGIGNDLMGGDASVDFVAGAAHGSDYLDGEAGNDDMYGDGGSDILYGGEGDDTLSGDSGVLDGAFHGNDQLWGESGNDQLIGGGGNDQLDGGDGADYLDGDSLEVAAEFNGNDSLDGGAGNDTMFGGGGNDVLDGGTGADQMTDHNGNDKLTGDAGDDSMNGGAGKDTLDGGVDNDLLFGMAGDDELLGGDGDDQLQGGEDNDSLDGGEGNDVLFGDAGDDMLAGGAGNDQLLGGAGDDSLDGGGGGDYLDGGEGDDTFTFAGGAFDGAPTAPTIADADGNNTLRFSYDPDGEVTVSLVQNSNDFLLRYGSDALYIKDGLVQATIGTLVKGNGAVMTRADIMNLVPALHVSGRSSADDILGGAQADTLDGGAGNDRLAGSGGDDALNGGAGDDTYVLGRGDGEDQIDNLAADFDTAFDRVELGAGIATGDVTLFRSGSDLMVDIGGGDSTLIKNYFAAGGTQKIDQIAFADGTTWDQAAIEQRITTPGATANRDILTGTDTAEVMHGLDGDDRLSGMGGNDQLFGDAGGDELYAGTGDDLLDGGTGYDRLYAGTGDDTLDGGTGDDLLMGEDGNDTYLFGVGDGTDNIYETGAAGDVDTLIMGAGVLVSNVRVTRSGNSVQLELRTIYNDITGDSVWLDSFLSLETGQHKIEQVKFADGTVWTAAMLKQMIDEASVTEGANNIYGYEYADVFDGRGGNDTMTGVGGDDSLSGGAGDDSIDGGNGNDVLDGGIGTDTLWGGSGGDTYLFGRGSGNDTIAETSVAGGSVDRVKLGAGIVPADIALYRFGNKLVMTINGSADELTIGAFFLDTVNGQAVDYKVERIVFNDGTEWSVADINARVIAEGPVNALTGTAGNDVFTVDNELDTVTEAANQGTDSVQSSVPVYFLPGNVENLTLTGNLNTAGYGNSLSNLITGNSHNNILDGGQGGVDTLIGGAGDDLYIDKNGSSVVVELADGGTDTLDLTYDASYYTMPDNVENLIFHSGYYYRIALYGNALDNVITGANNRGADSYDGGLGADTYINTSSGGYYYMDNLGDHVVIAGNTLGLHSVFSSIDWVLADDLDTLTLIDGSAAVSATAGTRGSTLRGNQNDNMLYGQGGADRIYGMAGDTLVGRGGHDTYYVDNGAYSTTGVPLLVDAGMPAPLIVEAADEGIDTVRSIHNHTLGANIENLILEKYSNGWSDGYASEGTGNALDNVLTGNAGHNMLDGAAGADTLIGGGGNDVYGVDNAGDVIVESSGIDTVRSTISYALTDAVEQLVLLGTDAISGTGNALDNTIDGAQNSAANVLAGGAGNDTYLLGEGDSLVEAVDGGFDTVSSSVAVSLAAFANVEGVILTGTAAVGATGNSGNNTLNGSQNAGANVLSGGAGDDTYVLGNGDVAVENAGEGRDTIVANNYYILGDHLEDLVLGAGGGYAYGNGEDNVLTGSQDNYSNYLDGKAGADHMIGGLANNTFVVDNVGDTVETNGWTDTVISSISYALGANVDNLTLSGAASINATGNGLSNTLIGNAGDNLFTGGNGSDTYQFGAGSGVDQIDNSATDSADATDTIALNYGITPAMVTLERLGADLVLRIGTNDAMTVLGYFGTDATQKIDQIRFYDGNVWNQAFIEANSLVAVTGTAGADALAGSAATDVLYGLEGNDTLTGLGGNDRLGGNAGDDLIDGGAGADMLAGGAGDDTFVVDNVGDSVLEKAGEGSDTVQASVSFTLSEAVEHLTLTGTAVEATGNVLANTLLGNASSNTFIGGAGNDTLTGGNGSDTYRFAAGDGQDRIDNTSTDSTTSTDIILMGAGITPGAIALLRLGDDMLIRMQGGDSITVVNYFVSGGAQKIDQIKFADNTIWNQADLESRIGLSIAGTAAAETLTGAAGADLIDALAGNDTLFGLDGNDILLGGAGDDLLDGGTGADQLAGGLGDDIYLVDEAGDSVLESVGEGMDRVSSSSDYILGDNVEDLLLTGDARDATGNALDNVLTGNDNDNFLDGAGGADQMIGGSGNDSYVFDDSGDVAVELADGGYDQVYASMTTTLGATLEALELTGSAAIDATGNALANDIRGNASANRLTGGAGDDYLYGRGGADTYLFGAGFGRDFVNDYTDVPGEVNVIRIEGASPADILIQRDVTGLVIRMANSSDRIYLDNWFAEGDGYTAFTLNFDDGTVWDRAALESRVAATQGTAFADTLYSDDAADNLDGMAGNDELFGEGGDDSLTGGTGDDYLDGGAGADHYIFNPGFGNDIVDETANEGETNTIVLHGVLPANLLVHRDAENLWLVAGGYANRIKLVDWFDDSAASAMQVKFDNGTIWNAAALESHISVAPSTEQDDVLWGGTGNDSLVGLGGADELYGFGGADTLRGGAGEDWLLGGAGADILDGGAGNDYYDYLQGDGLDTIIETVDAGTINYVWLDDELDPANAQAWRDGNDLLLVFSAQDKLRVASYFSTAITLEFSFSDGNWTAADIALMVALNSPSGTAGADSMNGGIYGDMMYGLDGNDTLNGNAGNDLLDGGIGSDRLNGGLGNDTYVVDNAGDVVTESSSQGTDLVQSSVSYTLTTNVENLTLTDAAPINGTGNTLNNVIVGNSAANLINGAAGNDTLSGGAGDDSYTVDSSADVIVENAGEGTDGVSSGVTYTLAANVENLTLTGTGAISGTGNAGDNALLGNAGANTLTGAAGNDTLNGAAGADTLVGGLGDDTYVVDNIGDVITELASAGTDLAQSGVTYTLGANVDNLLLTGTTAINGTGNAGGNMLTGNSAINTLTGAAGDDTLDGAAGADKLVGGLGNDTYIVDNTGDVITEVAGEGIDLVKSSLTHTLGTTLEALTLTGATAINGTGNASNNLVIGNDANNLLGGAAGTDILQGAGGADTLSDTAGNNLFDGGAGDDALTGGIGSELFIGGTGNDSITTAAGADVIAFNRGDGLDLINLSTAKDNTISLGKGITYADLLFKKNANDLVLVTGSGEQLTMKDWYVSTANRSVANLQIVIEGTSDYDAASGNALNNKKVERFNFDGLATAFDQALAANPALTSWALSSSLLSFHLGGSDTAAIGGDLAYQYARNGNLSSLTMTPAQALLASAQFGSAAQGLQASGALQDLTPRLM